jgi:hypothetical protein
VQRRSRRVVGGPQADAQRELLAHNRVFEREHAARTRVREQRHHEQHGDAHLQ